MKNAAYFLFTLLLTGFAGATATAQSRFSLAPTVGYDVLTANVKLRSSDPTPVFDQTITSAGQYTGFHAGLTAHYALSPKWSVSVGAQYSRLTGSTRGTSFYNTTVIDYAFDNQRLEQVQVPVVVNYTGSGRRVSPYLSAGMRLNYNYARRVDALSDLRPQATVGAGLLYRLAPKVSLIVQPTLGYELGHPPTISPLTYSTYRVIQVGLQMQVKFSF